MPKKRKSPPTATMEEVFQWFKDGVFSIVVAGRVFKDDKELTQRINCRNRMDDGDARVDLCHNGKRRSCHVSQLVWMWHADQVIPPGYEIHHRDENKHNNHWLNLLCVHPMDHLKLHDQLEEVDDIPF